MSIFLFLYATLAFYFQADVLFGAATGNLSVTALLAGEVYLLAANLMIAGLFRKNPDSFSVLLQLALWSAVAGPFGTIIAAGTFDLPLAKDDFANWLERQVETPHAKRIHALRTALRYGRLRIEGASATLSMNEIFMEGTLKEKLKALNIIVKQYQPSLAPILHLASKDVDAPTRVLAATVIGKLQATAGRSIAESEALAKSFDTPQHWIHVAEARMSYEASGLLSVAQRRVELASALAAIGEALRPRLSGHVASTRLEVDYRRLAAVFESLGDDDARERVYSLVAATKHHIMSPRIENPRLTAAYLASSAK